MKIFRSATFKLTAFYTAILMVICIGFSVVLYRTSVDSLGEGMPLGADWRQAIARPSEFDQLRQVYIDDASHRLASKLVGINLVMLAFAAGVSYYLARRTLEPIEKAMEAQGRFTSDASHELRTPLAVMQSEIEVALRDDGLGKSDLRKLLQSNLEEVEKLRGLSDRLLRLSSAEKTIDLVPASLEDIAIAATTRVVAQAQAKNITVDNLVKPLQIQADPASLADALVILLDNAIKYSPEGSKITLDSSQNDGQAVVRVVDEGIGIKASDLPHIFDRFYRADTSRTSQNVTGYGLGLPIAQQIVEQHSGLISVTSLPGRGTTFTLSFPVVTQR